MIIGAFEFRPRLLPSLFLLFGLPLLLSLGVWQLNRADEKAQIIQGYETRAKQARIRFDSISGDLVSFRHQSVELHGSYDTAHQMLLDNRTHNGHVGYQVITPFILSDGQRVLVNRGWIPAGKTRSDLPSVETPTAPIVLLGRIEMPPEKIFRLGSQEEPDRTGISVIQSLDLAYIATSLEQPLLPVVVQLDPEDPTGFVREWKAVYGIGPDKHRAYAMQWFSIAFILVVVYAGLSVSRKTPKQEI